MAHSTVGNPEHHLHITRDYGRYYHLLAALTLGVVIGVLSFAILASTIDAVRSVLPAETVAIEGPARPPVPLSPEWRWQGREPVQYEHMFREHGAADRELDWISDPARRVR